MNQLIHKPKNKFSTKEVLGGDIKSDWVAADQMHNECELESKIAQYFGNLRIREVTVLVDDLLILQRIIGYPSMKANNCWIAGTNCYIC